LLETRWVLPCCAARLWDVASGAELAVLRGHESAVWSAVFDPSGARALTPAQRKQFFLN
jgi:WD40 repeat protein